ncbi:putative Ig domain-containing protein [Methanococcoides alaskense]|uniref:Probable pectate lyase C n=1 Tax=Methanococcoides alaskense TaxID=325778 RepID=A0AA90U036_9EURY|nr:putative Ig domain-containing protein [Methanococcoides alaskense]MDA0524410.1 putative Ig domain-containing protein [Methanococcoides alaskense]MDR6223227.1 hypothetical protein [Methanococcoides alaskense]
MCSKKINFPLNIRCLLLFLFSVFILVPNVSANIDYVAAYNVIYVEDEQYVNLVDIYNDINDKSLINVMNGDIWTINAAIYSKNSTVSITDSEASEVRLTGNSDQTKLLYGWDDSDVFRIKNVHLTGWNLTSSMPEVRGGLILHNPEFNNVTVRNTTAIQIYGHPIGNLSNITTINTRTLWLDNVNDTYVYNIQIEDLQSASGDGLYIFNSDNLTMYNISVVNLPKSTESGILLDTVSNSELYDVFVEHIGDSLDEGSAGLGVSLTKGYNNYIHDIYINDTGWSGLGISGGERFIRAENIVVRNYGHNGLDIHPCNDAIINNISIYDSVRGNNILITAGYHDNPSASNITINNIYSEGAGVIIQNNVSDVTITNLTQIDGGIGMGDAKNITVINATFTNTTNFANPWFNKISLYELDGVIVKKSTIIDASINCLDSDKAIDPKFINVEYDVLWGSDNISVYKYPDIIVQNSTGSAIANADVLFVNDLVQTVDGYGNYKNIFSTIHTGRLPLPEDDRFSSPAIVEFYRSSDSLQYPQYDVVVTTQVSDSLSLTGVIPDSTWYRSDPNIPTYTITAIILDDSTGPQVTGFAPAEFNPFNMGDTKKFQVWTDEDLTTMKWFVDGELVSQNSLEYTWTVPDEDGHTITFEGTNSSGTITKTWDINSGSGNVMPAISSIFPGTSTLSQEFGTSTDFSVIADQSMTSMVWYKNDEIIAEGAMATTVDWEESGVYDIRFTASNDNGFISRLWEVLVDSNDGATSIMISSSTQVVAPNQPFTIDISIDPSEPITGAQFDLLFDGQLVTVDSVIEGDLFSQDGASTLFNIGTTNNLDGIITDVYCSILGASPVSSEGAMASITFTAGSTAGIAELGLSDVVISNANSEQAPRTVSGTTVVIDTAPVLTSIGDRTVDGESSLSFVTSGSDADGDSLTYSVTGLPSGASFDTVSGIFSWTPSVGQAGTYTITFEVTDGYIADSESISIIVESHPRWDVNRDGMVNILDVTLVGQNMGTENINPNSDVYQDGEVNVQDVTLVAQYFGETVK